MNWGDHIQKQNAAYSQAFEEWVTNHPKDAGNRFIDLSREAQTWILARQVELAPRNLEPVTA